MGCCFDVGGLNGVMSELGFFGFLGFYDFIGCCFSVSGLNGDNIVTLILFFWGLFKNV